MSYPEVATISHDVVHAGFLRRWAALFIDSLILSSVYYALFMIAMLVAVGVSGLGELDGDEPPAALVGAYLAVTALYFVIAGLYYALLESSSSQASVGKMALGIKVTDRDGHRLGFAHALGRWVAALLSYLTCYIGFFMAGFTARKQALHDLVAGTLVVDRWAFTDSPERQQRQLHGCLIAFLIVFGLCIALAVLGVVAAIALPAYLAASQRTHVTEALSQTEALRQRIQTRVLSAEDGECPDNRSDGYLAAQAYASATVSHIDIGASDEGGCGFTLWLAEPGRGATGEYVALRFDAAAQRWICDSSLSDAALPESCR